MICISILYYVLNEGQVWKTNNKDPFTLSVCVHDASDTVLIKIIGVAPKWGCNPFFQSEKYT